MNQQAGSNKKPLVDANALTDKKSSHYKQRWSLKIKEGGLDYEAHTDWSPRPGPGIEIITLGFLE